MAASPEVWDWALREAHAGRPPLLELLLVPAVEDSKGNPAPDSLQPLPQDQALRLRIVRTLMFGPWGGATSVADLMTRERPGSAGKWRLSDREVSFAALLLHVAGGKGALDDLADGYGVDTSTLRKAIARARRRKELRG